MSREEIYDALLPVFQDVFDDTELKINDETTSKDIMGWDSLLHINLIVAIEDEFNVKFSLQDVYNAKNVGELVDSILALQGGEGR